jgi:hypothetical protein
MDAIMMRYSDGMMVRMQIQFTEEQAAELRNEARQRGVSISSIVRERCLATAWSERPATDRASSIGRLLDKTERREPTTGFHDVSRDHDAHYGDVIYEEIQENRR